MPHAVHGAQTHVIPQRSVPRKNIITSANRPIDHTAHVAHACSRRAHYIQDRFESRRTYSCTAAAAIQIARMDLMLKSRDRNAVPLTQNSPSTRYVGRRRRKTKKEKKKKSFSLSLCPSPSSFQFLLPPHLRPSVFSPRRVPLALRAYVFLRGWNFRAEQAS